MMNRSKTYFSNPLKAILSLIIIVFFAAFSVFYFVTGRWVEGIVFALIMIAFCIVLYLYGSVLIISRECISLRFLFFERKRLYWEEIAEVGILGERVTNRSYSKKKTGTLYIYFSEKKMNDSERFQMGLKWPPRNIPYTTFTEEKISFIQLFWADKIALYNVGNLEL